MEKNEEKTETNVEECPKPPDYYKLFTQSNDIKPPLPPTKDNELLEGQYNGSMAALLKSRTIVKEEKNYNVELKRLLDKLLKASLPEINISSNTGYMPLNFSYDLVNSILNEIRECLSDYRIHYARERLINEMENKLLNITKIEEEIKSILENN